MPQHDWQCRCNKQACYKKGKHSGAHTCDAATIFKDDATECDTHGVLPVLALLAEIAPSEWERSATHFENLFLASEYMRVPPIAMELPAIPRGVTGERKTKMAVMMITTRFIVLQTA